MNIELTKRERDFLTEFAKKQHDGAKDNVGTMTPKDNVSYGGYTFSPVRNFEEEEFKTITKHLRSDRELGFSKYDGAKHLWSYEDFYKACSENKRAQNCDIFYCIETGKYYIPGENELFEYVTER